ncbi:MAG: pseudouridylate synthase [Bacteroidales bacterium]|nr:pseudouridylate synthase [Bacteroidales bacterium]
MSIEDVTGAFLRSIDIHTVLPQRDPFVMVGTLVHWEPGSSTTETRVRADNLFVENGVFSSCGLLENIAQTCAARIGFYNRYILGQDVQIGYIGAIRDYVVTGQAPVGSLLTTTVDVLEEVFGMTLAVARVCCDGVPIAGCRVKLAIKDREG